MKNIFGWFRKDRKILSGFLISGGGKAGAGAETNRKCPSDYFIFMRPAAPISMRGGITSANVGSRNFRSRAWRYGA